MSTAHTRFAVFCAPKGQRTNVPMEPPYFQSFPTLREAMRWRSEVRNQMHVDGIECTTIVQAESWSDEAPQTIDVITIKVDVDGQKRQPPTDLENILARW